MRNFKALALITIAGASLTACSTVTEAVKGPELAPIGYPAALVPQQQMVMVPQNERPAASSNSLWRAGARTFFNDQRARHVGDILTVSIDINDSAQTQNTTARSRDNEYAAGVGNFFGLGPRWGRFCRAAMTRPMP